MLIFVICYAKNFLFASSRNIQTTTFVNVINKFVIHFENNININLFEFVVENFNELIVENFDKLTENVFSFFKNATIDFRRLKKKLISNVSLNR